MKPQDAKRIKESVRKHYADRIKTDESCCSSLTDCCPDTNTDSPAEKNGYTETQISSIPTDAAEHSFGCGNPLEYTDVHEGDVVVDLGSGAGIDVLLASQLVGESGKAIGIDMTPEMIVRARENAEEAGAKNVDFRLGEIESMPLENESVDWIISNCVICLSPDKDKVFEEAYRVLKPGGRLVVSDMVANNIPGWARTAVSAWVSCISGALPEDKYLDSIRQAGFENIRVLSKSAYAKMRQVEVASVKVEAVKPV
ncbi:MAG: arsenite methyltransferase [Candidatus Poribacteria bacterium]|nr:arsenite methyltransferase [Candidatus Poribacteria bacterium]